MADSGASPRVDRIVVRRATTSDLDVVIALRIALLREYSGHPIYGRLREDAADRARPVFEQQLRGLDQAIFLVERNGDVAGIARCTDSRGSPLLYPSRYCYVTSVYVKPEHRRRGLLVRLMAEVEAWAISRGLSELRLHNSTTSAPARGAWDQLGYEVNEEVRLKRLDR